MHPAVTHTEVREQRWNSCERAKHCARICYHRSVRRDGVHTMAASAIRSLPLPPGARGYPIIGETGDWARDPLLFAQDRHARHGPIWQTHLLGRPCVVLLGPEANRFILGSHMHLFSSRAGWSKTITSLIGDGLSLLDGAAHRRHRTMIMPALHGAALSSYFATMHECVATHAAGWLAAGELKLFDGFKRLSFDIATR